MAATTQTISAEELAQRVAVLRRFRELLVQQRERFHRYLALLDKQETVIQTGSAAELLTQVELEEQIVTDILSIQKVIDPLETLYQAAVFSTTTATAAAPADDVPTLKVTLENLKSQAAARSAHNRDLLSARMVELRSEITELRNNPLANASRSKYQNSVSASLVDISG